MQMKWVGHKFKTDQGRLLKHGTFLHRVLGKIKACALKPSKLYSAQFKPDKKRKQQKTKTNESFQPCTPVKVKNSALNTPLNPGNYNPTTKTLQPVLAFLATPHPPPKLLIALILPVTVDAMIYFPPLQQSKEIAHKAS